LLTSPSCCRTRAAVDLSPAVVTAAAAAAATDGALVSDVRAASSVPTVRSVVARRRSACVVSRAHPQQPSCLSAAAACARIHVGAANDTSTRESDTDIHFHVTQIHRALLSLLLLPRAWNRLPMELRHLRFTPLFKSVNWKHFIYR